MRLRADFGKPATIRPGDYAWSGSPAGGVERMMLDRVGDEIARATSIVRFAPDSHFDPHTHGGGEEILVLEGVFSDETGDFPAGFYLRNPIGTAHRPHSLPGCKILVKLHQFDPADTATVRIDTRSAEFEDGGIGGLSVLHLHRYGAEEVRMLRLEPGTEVPSMPLPGGGELLVVEGALVEAAATCPAGSWLRRPRGSSLALSAPEGATFWLKTGHLSA